MPKPQPPPKRPPPRDQRHAVTRPTPALQTAPKLIPRNPYTAALVLPRETAQEALGRILARYPSTTAPRNHRSALRMHGAPSVTALLMPPDQDGVTLLLFANVPPDSAERWTLADDPAAPLTWRRYEVARVPDIEAEADKLRRPQKRRREDAERHTWRLSREARQMYRQQITQTIQNGKPAPQQAASLAALGKHLLNLPGARGIRADVWMLSQHMRRLWRKTHPGTEPPAWGRLPNWKPTTATAAPLADCWPPIPKERQP